MVDERERYANGGRRAKNKYEITTSLFSRRERQILGM
jgi:hypothetical protein